MAKSAVFKNTNEQKCHHIKFKVMFGSHKTLVVFGSGEVLGKKKKMFRKMIFLQFGCLMKNL